MLRGLCILFGLAILGATAHVTIEHTGGYQSPHAVLTIAIAAGVGIGSLILGAAWRAGRYALVVAIAIALLCGELFGLVRTAERLVDARAEAQAPYRAATKTRADAVKRVEQLSANLKSLPTTSTRLETAVRNKQAADRAVVEQASLRGCRKNCRQLLQDQVNSAAAEIEAARAEIERQRQSIQVKFAKAQSAVKALPAGRSATPLADRLGVEPWLIDLVTAALGAMGANGLAACLLVFGAHAGPAPRTTIAREARKDSKAVDVVTVDVPPAAPVRKVTRRTKPKLIAANEMPIYSPTDFIADMLDPEEGGKVELEEIHQAYEAECERQRLKPVDGNTFFDVLEQFCQEFSIESKEVDEHVFLLGIKIAQPVVTMKRGRS
jgi:hypothetical protein